MTFFRLLKLTEQGIQALRNQQETMSRSPRSSRTTAARRRLVYAGDYDMISIIEAEDDKAMRTISARLAVKGLYTGSLPAMPLNDFMKRFGDGPEVAMFLELVQSGAQRQAPLSLPPRHSRGNRRHVRLQPDPGFYKLRPTSGGMRSKRMQTWKPMRSLHSTGALSMENADLMVENVIGTLTRWRWINLLINGRDVVVPMAVEEPASSQRCPTWQSSTTAGGFTEVTTT